MVVFAGAWLFHLVNAGMLPLLGGESTRSRRRHGRESAHRRLHRGCPRRSWRCFPPGRAAPLTGGDRRFVLMRAASSRCRSAASCSRPPSLTEMLVAVQTLERDERGGVRGDAAARRGRPDASGRERFNLCMGVSAWPLRAARRSARLLAGWIADALGESAAFMGLALAGALGTALVWLAMPETRDETELVATPAPAGGR